MVTIIGGAGNFAPMIMVVERGYATGAPGLLEILVSYSHFRYDVLCVS
jgi:hypothetical protein